MATLMIFQVNSSSKNDELIVSVFYPEDAPLLEHATGDVVHIAYDQSCDCGYHGHTLHLKGRTAIFYNIYRNFNFCTRFYKCLQFSRLHSFGYRYSTHYSQSI